MYRHYQEKLHVNHLLEFKCSVKMEVVTRVMGRTVVWILKMSFMTFTDIPPKNHSQEDNHPTQMKCQCVFKLYRWFIARLVYLTLNVFYLLLVLTASLLLLKWIGSEKYEKLLTISNYTGWQDAAKGHRELTLSLT